MRRCDANFGHRGAELSTRSRGQHSEAIAIAIATSVGATHSARPRGRLQGAGRCNKTVSARRITPTVPSPQRILVFDVLGCWSQQAKGDTTGLKDFDGCIFSPFCTHMFFSQITQRFFLTAVDCPAVLSAAPPCPQCVRARTTLLNPVV